MVEVGELVLRLFQPRLIGFCRGEVGLQFLVSDDAAFIQIDQQHLAGLEAPFAGDVFFGEGQHAAFRGEHHQILLRGAPARRPQAVAIKTGAYLLAVGEAHGSRSIPRLHQGGVIFVKCAACRVHLLVLGPGFGHEHHHGMCEAVSTRQQQLERIVEAGGIGLAMRNERPHLVEVGAQQFAFHRATARFHPVHIAANRVDFAVMRHEAIGVGKPPAGEGVGAETLVHEAQCADAIGIAQIVVECADLIGEQQALVDDGAAVEARNIGLAEAGNVMLGLQRGQRVQRLLADDDQLALESLAAGAIHAACDYALANDRHGGDDCIAQAIERGRYVAPADNALALLFGKAFELAFHELPRFLFLRKKAHGDGVVAFIRQFVLVRIRPLADQRIGCLDKNAGAIAQQRIRAHRAAMVEIGKNGQRLADNPVTLFALDMRDHAYAAGIMFVARIVKALRIGAITGCMMSRNLHSPKRPPPSPPPTGPRHRDSGNGFCAAPHARPQNVANWLFGGN